MIASSFYWYTNEQRSHHGVEHCSCCSDVRLLLHIIIPSIRLKRTAQEAVYSVYVGS